MPDSPGSGGSGGPRKPRTPRRATPRSPAAQPAPAGETGELTARLQQLEELLSGQAATSPRPRRTPRARPPVGPITPPGESITEEDLYGRAAAPESVVEAPVETEPVADPPAAGQETEARPGKRRGRGKQAPPSPGVAFERPLAEPEAEPEVLPEVAHEPELTFAPAPVPEDLAGEPAPAAKPRKRTAKRAPAVPVDPEPVAEPVPEPEAELAATAVQEEPLELAGDPVSAAKPRKRAAKRTAAAPVEPEPVAEPALEIQVEPEVQPSVAAGLPPESPRRRGFLRRAAKDPGALDAAPGETAGVEPALGDVPLARSVHLAADSDPGIETEPEVTPPILVPARPGDRKAALATAAEPAEPVGKGRAVPVVESEADTDLRPASRRTEPARRLRPGIKPAMESSESDDLSGTVGEQPSRVKRTLPELPTDAVQLRPVGSPEKVADKVLQLMAVLIVLFLALAAGFGAAAIVESHQGTYSDQAIVRLDPGSAPTTPAAQAIAAGIIRYEAQASGRAFTVNTLHAFGLGSGIARADIKTRVRTGRGLMITVSATSRTGAKKLAAAAAAAFVQLVNEDQAANVISPGDRLSAQVVVRNGPVKKIAPSSSKVLLVALLAAIAVVVLGGVGFALRGLRTS